MKPCPVCNTEVEDLYTGFCPNQVCTWEFEFVSEMTPEVLRRYEEKLRRAKAAYARLNYPPREHPTKLCPVCNTEVEDLYTGLCPNTDCSWEFDFLSEMTPELQMRHEEKLTKALKIYNVLRKVGKKDIDSEKTVADAKSKFTSSNANYSMSSGYLSSGSNSDNFPGAHIIEQ